MQTADVVLYDRLVSDDILQLVHGGARMVYVGKQAGYHTRTQVCGGCLQDTTGGCLPITAVVAARIGQSTCAFNTAKQGKSSMCVLPTLLL
jgi:siroheme synthase